MLSPSSRLLWIIGLAVFPCLCIAPLVPAAAAACVAVIALVCVFAGWDAWRGIVSARAVTVQGFGDGEHKWFKGRPEVLSFEVNAACEFALDLPGSLTAEQPVAAANGKAAVEITPQARGRYRVERSFIRLWSPFGLWRVDATKAIAIAMRVFPDLDAEPGAASLLRQRHMGPQRQRPVGRGREFERLREYAPGDSYEEIYWKATARKGSPVVKVFQIERTQDVYVVLDTSIRSGPAERMDRFVRGALMVALATEMQGDRFGLVTFDRQVTRFVPADKGKEHFARCRDAIFDVSVKPVAPDFDEIFSFLQLRVRRRALLLFITDLEDPIAAESFVSGGRLLTRKYLLVVATVADEKALPLFSAAAADIHEIHGQLAGHLAWAAFGETRRKLRQIGAMTHTLRRDSIGMDLVAEYAQIKQRQIL